MLWKGFAGDVVQKLSPVGEEKFPRLTQWDREGSTGRRNRSTKVKER